MASVYNGTVKSIDTSLFDSTVSAFKSAISQYREIREKIFVMSDRLFQTWDGDGGEAFEKQYKLLKTRLTDEEDNLRTIAEDLENMRQSYIDWDTELSAKMGRK